MALQTKSIIGDGSRGHHRFTLTVTENSTSVSSNSSSVSWAFVLSPIVNGYDWKYANSVPVTYTITINGVNYTGNIMEYDYPDGKATVTVTSGSATISHNADGQKTLNFSFSVSSASASYLPGSAGASGSMVLTDIPKKATITSAPGSFAYGKSVTIGYSVPSVATKVEACIASKDGADIYVPYREISLTGTSYTFTFTEAEKSALGEAATGNTLDLAYYLRTTLNGQKYYDYKFGKMTIGNANPIVTASVVDANPDTVALTGDNTKLVKFFSTAKCTASAEAQKGATIDNDSYVISNGNRGANAQEAEFANVENNVFYFEVVDSRGNGGEETITSPMVEYVKLTCILGNDKPDGEGKMSVTCSGNFFNDSFGAVDNTLTAQYRYRTQSGVFGDWADMNITKVGNSYYADAYLTGLDNRTPYVFECRAVDKLMTVSSTSTPLKSTPIFHWSENDFVFEVPVTFNGGVEMPTAINDDGEMVIASDLRLKGDGNYGNSLRFGDGNYCYITEATDDVMTIKATRINLEASGVYVYGNPIPAIDKGVWSPYLNSAVVSSYTTQYGWYSKLGQTVSVGFFIKATCRSGYDSTTISISGLPFTPMFSAAGGGMCSGAYVGGGYNFQCFVAETSGSITTRVQSCNHTSQKNLDTSASGCNYPSGGGVITLSGTITFMSNS